jgi:hypothetical protein
VQTLGKRPLSMGHFDWLSHSSGVAGPRPWREHPRCWPLMPQTEREQHHRGRYSRRPFRDQAVGHYQPLSMQQVPPCSPPRSRFVPEVAGSKRGLRTFAQQSNIGRTSSFRYSLVF